MSLHIPDHADFNFPATGKFYIEFDFKTSLAGSSDAIFRKLNSFLFRRVYNEDTQCYSFVLHTGLPEPQVYSFSIVAATKYHIKVEYDNSKYELYVDTVKLEPASYQDNAILESNDGFIFGYSHPVNSRFRVKEIKIYVVEDTPVVTNPNWTLSDDDDPLTVLKSEQYCDIKDTDDEEEITKRDDLLNLLGEMITAQMIDYLDNTDIDPYDPPLVLRRAALKQTTYEFKQKRTPGLQSVQYTDGSTQKYQIDEWLLDVKKILERHIKITI